MYQVGAVCYSTALAANQATASAQAGSVVLVGGQSQVLSIESVTGEAITYGYTPLGGAGYVSQSVAIIPQPCGLLGVDDALYMSWAVATCWLLVYAITFITNYIKIEMKGTENDT